MIVIGYTDVTEVDPKYFDRIDEEQLINKKFVRCSICKDVIEKRKHFFCQFKKWLKKLGL